MIENKPVNQDSIPYKYSAIFSTYPFTANTTGYKGLESKGLDIIKDDLLRVRITYYYNYYFEILSDLENENGHFQDSRTYFFRFNDKLSPYMEFNKNGDLIKINQPIVPKRKNLTVIYGYYKISKMVKYNFMKL